MAIVTQKATVTTVDATPTTLWLSPTGVTAGFVIYVSGHAAGPKLQALWAFHVHRTASDGTVLGADIHTTVADVGANWAVSYVENAGALEVAVTGSATTVDWTALVQQYD